MDKDGDVKNQTRVEMMELDAIMKEKTAEEIRSQEGQPMLDKILKQNSLFSDLVRPLITSGRAPQDNFLGLNNALIYQPFEVSLKTLTCFPPIARCGGGLGILPLHLGGALLAAILVVMSHFTHMCSRAEDWGGRAAL
jgi:hypothetical protein